MKTSAAQWSERVRAWEASGRSAEEFARGKQFSGKTLRWWRGEFARRGRESSASPVAMARVLRPGEKLNDSALAVVVGQFRIELVRGFDEVLLRDVLRVVGATE